MKGTKKSTLFSSDSGIAFPIEEQPAINIAIRKENILALDVATNTGFATSVASGHWNLTPKKDESKGMRLIKFRAKLQDMASNMPLKIIVFETAVAYGAYPNMVGAEMIGVMKLWCEENSIEYKSYAPTAIKKFATTKGNAGKEAMVKAAQQRWNMQGNNDNEADALAIYNFALEDLGIVKPAPII